MTKSAAARTSNALEHGVQRTSFHVGVLASFALTQPLLDLLGGAPDFLVAHDLSPAELVAVAVVAGVLVPGLCAAVVHWAGRLHHRMAWALTSAFLSGFLTLIVLSALRSRESAPGWVMVGVSLGLAILGTAAYWRMSGFRRFVTWLSPGVVLFPLIFLVRPGVWGLVWPSDAAMATHSGSTTPVVMVVFDSLPLTALLDEHHAIDRRLYPAFAALADQATWYRNATTVSDYTRWALPAMVTGLYPTRAGLPTSSHHPESLFTLLESSHDFRVYEPITRLCPSRLCAHDTEDPFGRLVDLGGTLSVAYLHRVLPTAFESHLPPVDQGWTDGIPPVSPGELWLEEGDGGRRSTLISFIEAIEDTAPAPAAYFIHALLPHTPIAYFPNGQRFTSARFLPGLLEGRDRWAGDEWAVAQGYRLFLLQVGYVDRLLGRLVDRLKTVGLYDRALVIVASDHGASFRAGHSFRRVSDETFMDIVPIPLLIKEPHQQTGVVSDRNVETIDILPTIADLLGARVPWPTDGASVRARATRPLKSVYYDDARRVRTFNASLLDDVYASVDRRLALFGSSDANPYHVPETSPNHDLIGRAVDDLQTSDDLRGIEFTLDSRGDFNRIDPDSLFVPASLSGRARRRSADGPVTLAVAVNGTVAATTQTFVFDERGSLHTWSIVLNPDTLQPGRNLVEVFVVDTAGNSPVLRRAYRSPSQG